MKNVPFISVVIPSYNSEDYIEETLNSLAAQTFTDFEVIIIDDQSTDNTFDIAQAVHDKLALKGKVICRPDGVPKGVSGCRNYGIKIASGDWISFLDSDDLFHKDKILGTIKLIEKYGEHCYIYFHGAKQFEDGTNTILRISSRSTYEVPLDILQELTHKNFITTSSVTLKKSLINDIGGFDSNLHGIEDYMLWLRVSKRTKWYYSAEAWTDYRVRKTSLMGGREMKYYIEQNRNLIKAVKNTNEFTPQEITAIEYYLFDDIMGYYAVVSLNARGWGDFLKGLIELRKVGKGKLASTLFKRHFGFLARKKISFLKKS